METIEAQKKLCYCKKDLSGQNYISKFTVDKEYEYLYVGFVPIFKGNYYILFNHINDKSTSADYIEVSCFHDHFTTI
jgi:hypothetical protein